METSKINLFFPDQESNNLGSMAILSWLKMPDMFWPEDIGLVHVLGHLGIYLFFLL